MIQTIMIDGNDGDGRRDGNSDGKGGDGKRDGDVDGRRDGNAASLEFLIPTKWVFS